MTQLVWFRRDMQSLRHLAWIIRDYKIKVELLFWVKVCVIVGQLLTWIMHRPEGLVSLWSVDSVRAARAAGRNASEPFTRFSSHYFRQHTEGHHDNSMKVRNETLHFSQADFFLLVSRFLFPRELTKTTWWFQQASNRVLCQTCKKCAVSPVTATKHLGRKKRCVYTTTKLSVQTLTWGRCY